MTVRYFYPSTKEFRYCIELTEGSLRSGFTRFWIYPLDPPCVWVPGIDPKPKRAELITPKRAVILGCYIGPIRTGQYTIHDKDVVNGIKKKIVRTYFARGGKIAFIDKKTGMLILSLPIIEVKPSRIE